MWLVLWIGLIAWPGARADNPNLVTGLAWLEDTSGQMTWEDAQSASGWHVAQGNEVVSMGYGKNPIWFRLRISPARAGVTHDDKLLLRIRPNYLDELILFDPAQTPAQRPPVGDRHSKANQYEPSLFLNLAIPAGTQDRDIWVRMRSNNTRQVYFEIMDAQSMHKSNTLLAHVGALYISILLVFLVWGCIQLIDQFNPLRFYFVTYQAMALLFGTFLFGYPHLYLENWVSPVFLDKSFSAIAILATHSVGLFSNELLDGISKSSRRTQLNRLVHVVLVVCLILLASPWPYMGLQINMLLILLMPFYYLASVMNRNLTDQTFLDGIPKRVMVGYFGINLFITLLTALPALKIIPGAEFSLYVVSLYSVSSGLMMLMLLQYKSIQALRQHSLLMVEAENATQQAQRERQHREETEHLLAMLGHELKTPLSTLLLKINSPGIAREVSTDMGSSIAEMNNIIERTIQIGQINHEKILIHLESFDLVDLIKPLLASFPESQRIALEVSDTQARNINSDPYLLSTIVRNLVDNALKYSSPDTLVTIQLRRTETSPHWHLLVKNQPGRASWPDPERVFEKYYRNAAATYRSGTGLGLYLVKALSDRLGYGLTYCPTTDEVVFRLDIPGGTRP